MKKIIVSLILTFAVTLLQAKDWQIIGEMLDADTTSLVQDEVNPNLYKLVGRIQNKPFKLFDGTNTYIPVCGLNDPFDQSIDIDIQTDETQTPFRVSYVKKDQLYRISLTDGTLPKLRVDIVTPLPALYLVGGPVNTNTSNWLLRDARELDKDPTDPFVFYFRGFLKYNTQGDERGSIKFLPSNTSWDNGFHPVGTTNVPLAQATKMRRGGADTKWEIPADGSGNGYYVIKINTLEETIQVVEFQRSDEDYPSRIYIAGDAMPCGWDNTNPEVMEPVNVFEGKYSWRGKVTAGQFKFLKSKNNWGSCYVSTTENQPVQFGTLYPVIYELDYISSGGNDYKFVFEEAGNVVINIDLKNLKMKVDQETGIADDPLAGSDITVSTKEGKLVIRSSSTASKNYSVYSVDGRKIHTGAFVDYDEKVLDKGYYILNVIDETNRKLVMRVLL